MTLGEKVVGAFHRVGFILEAKGRDGSLLQYNCRLCGDQRKRGWIALPSLRAGCFNAGCDAYTRLPGGARALYSRFSSVSLDSLLGTVDAFSSGTPLLRPVEPVPLPVLEAYESASSFTQRQLRDVRHEWGLQPETIERWGGFACGPRLWFPVDHSNPRAAFVGRLFPSLSVKGPKYRFVGHAQKSHVLFGAQMLVSGTELVVVEGVMDTLRFDQDYAHTSRQPVAMFGATLSDVQCALVADLDRRTIYAPDNDATHMARQMCRRLREEWDVDVRLGRWLGAKDAGGGGRLAVEVG